MAKNKWKPKKDDCYYVPDIIAVNKYRFYYYDNDNADKFFFENGFACESRAEAERLHDWIVDQVKKYRVID